MPILPNEKKALNVLRTTLLDHYSLLDIRLYGSKAKGTDVRESDLDVMIVLDDYSSDIESEIDDLIFDINLKYNCFISALFFSRKELDVGPLTESPIYKKILQEGISL
ncbi:MAG: nucleotidyltransferase domain-containing protein [Deltaproteobacteria bacterium]|nr:nucleotidyltransferase domain-containing protein [Deltaproteobacteria bacterium]